MNCRVCGEEIDLYCIYSEDGCDGEEWQHDRWTGYLPFHYAEPDWDSGPGVDESFVFP